jgi:hypothetical protein
MGGGRRTGGREDRGTGGERNVQCPPSPTSSSKRQTVVAGLLVTCVILVGFWEVMSNRSRRAFEAFEITNEDFEDFVPAREGWTVESLPVTTTAIEPNIVVFRYVDDVGAKAISRLVHGYNMCDCMRIKGYEVELVADTRDIEGVEEDGLPSDLQVWRLESPGGSANAIWITSMLRAGNFAPTAVDVRSMAFPRVGMVDDPNWVPQGFTLRSLRHPIKNLRMLFRAKWNNARGDLWTFLRLKQPAWASDDMLTLVSASRRIPPSVDESEVIAQVVSVHTHMLQELQTWRAEKTAEED